MTLPYLESMQLFFAFRAVFFAEGAAPHEITAGIVIAIGLHAEFFLT